MYLEENEKFNQKRKKTPFMASEIESNDLITKLKEQNKELVSEVDSLKDVIKWILSSTSQRQESYLAWWGCKNIFTIYSAISVWTS